MSDFEDLVASKVIDAIETARASGRDDIADYLALKASNDSVRHRETDDLFKAFIGIALSAENVARNVEVERESPHSFRYRDAHMKGSLLRITRGLRSLTIEAGWTRAPGDGFMRLGAMAVARLTHYGMPDKNAILLLKPHGGEHSWFELKSDRIFETAFRPEDVERHIETLLNDRVR